MTHTTHRPCPNCSPTGNTVQVHTVAYDLPPELDTPLVNDEPVWWCQNCNAVLPRRARRNKMQMKIDRLVTG